MKFFARLMFLALCAWTVVACSNAGDDSRHEASTNKGSSADPELVSAVHEMADKRMFDKSLLLSAIENGYPEALSLFGHSGDTACVTIRSFLTSEDNDILRAAVAGTSKCADASAFGDLYLLASDDKRPNEVRVGALKAMGFASDEEDRKQISSLVTMLLSQADTNPDLASSSVYGLMQNIVYAGLSPSALPDLNIDLVMDAAKRNDRLGFEAAYLLMRMQGLRAALDFKEVEDAVATSTIPEKTYALLRVAGQFGNAASDTLVRYGSSDTNIEGNLSTDMFNGAETRSVAVAAILAMAGLDDDQSLTYLFRLLNQEDVALKQTALSVMARRSDADTGVVQRMWDFARGDNEWLATTALSGLAGFGDPNALYQAEEWLENASFYKAFQAVSILSRSPEGQELLQDYVTTASDPMRTQMVMRTLDPNAVNARKARETVPYGDAMAATAKRLKLTTTRGDIVIQMIENAPYAAHNFVTLVSEGKLDGMVWHRVIPGFVAQAGQRDDVSQFETPTIREEWGAALHQPGTVGVATSGPDTGTAQFFINLMHNRHLDGRYTVFGSVVSGPYGQLQEGDVILRAEVID